MPSGELNITDQGDSKLRKHYKLAKIKKVRMPKNKCTAWFRKPENIQLIMTISSVVLGLALGFIIKTAHPDISPRTVNLVAFPGELLMNMLKLLIIPLITSSLISGLANLDIKSCGKIGTYALLYYFTTTLLAVIIGIVLVVSIHPGNPGIKEERGEGTMTGGKGPNTLDALMDLFRLIRWAWDDYNGEDPDVNSEGLVTFSVAFGLCIATMGASARLMLDFFIIMNEIIMRLVRLIMWYAPFGIVFLIIGKIIGLKDLAGTAAGLGLYMLTVISGLFLHLFVSLMGIYFLVTRKNPLVYFKGLFQAFFMALGTASSSATLPITFKCLEETLGIDPRVTRFVLPIGATVNMDGTALYEAVACIFIAQINEISLSIGQLITISITATLAAIGAASVPSAGLVTMVLVLTSVGLPVNDITLILAVDWMLDRIRTSINVMGDAYGAGVVAHLCRKQLVNPARRLTSVCIVQDLPDHLRQDHVDTHVASDTEADSDGDIPPIELEENVRKSDK